MGSADGNTMMNETQLNWTVLQTKVRRGKRKTTARVAAVVIRSTTGVFSADKQPYGIQT